MVPETIGMNFLPKKAMMGPVNIRTRANTHGYLEKNTPIEVNVATEHPAL